MRISKEARGILWLAMFLVPAAASAQAKTGTWTPTKEAELAVRLGALPGDTLRLRAVQAISIDAIAAPRRIGESPVLRGLVYGFTAGALAGMVVGGLSHDRDSSHSRGEEVMIGGVVYGITGAAIGTVVGTVVSLLKRDPQGGG